MHQPSPTHRPFSVASLGTRTLLAALIWMIFPIPGPELEASGGELASPREDVPATAAAAPKELALRATRALQELFEASDRRQLAQDPLGALWRGELDYVDHFGDYITPGHFIRQALGARRDLEGLSKIRLDLLSETDRLSHAAFHYQQGLIVRAFDSGVYEVQRRLPLDHLFGYHVTFPDMSSGTSIAPFHTVEDYENGRRRLEGFAVYLRRAKSAMQEGIESKHVLPRFAAIKVLDQLKTTLEQGIDGSPLLAPTRSFPAAVSEADHRRLAKEYRATLEGRVLPAYRDLARFMESTYLPASRTGAPGLLGMPDGPKLYRYLVEQHTGMTLSPEEIHQIGLEEVARIRAEMEAIKRRVGFDGDLQEFFEHLRSHPRFRFASGEALLAAYGDVRKKLEPRLGRLFSTLPRTSFEIRPVPTALEKTAGGAYYNPGNADGSRPGVFYVNTHDLASRTNPTIETLFLHEAVPGHHLQASLAQENDALPAFMRFNASTAYVEGWALYAESLGPELGMFEDPYQRFGHLDLEMFRALRLVVDTGLHAKGWSRRQAVDYMLENSSLGRTVVLSDVDRYVVWPGQALAYKLGQLEIRRLRTEAENRLGDGFEIREFHAQVLGSGALPLPILGDKVQAWIARQESTRLSRSSGGSSPKVEVARRDSADAGARRTRHAARDDP